MDNDNSANNVRLQRLKVKGFLSIREADLTFDQNLNVLIGPNGAGKSNLLQLFELLSWITPGQRLQRYIGLNGGANALLFMGAKQTREMEIGLHFSTPAGTDDYECRLEYTHDDRMRFIEERHRFLEKDIVAEPNWEYFRKTSYDEAQITDTTTTTRKTMRFLLTRCAPYHFHDTSYTAPIMTHWKVDDCVYMRSDGGNLAPILLELQQHEPKRYRRIVEIIRLALPEFGDFVLEPLNGSIQLKWHYDGRGEMAFAPHLTSDGTLRFMALTTLLNMPAERLPGLLLIDEPELGIHPYAIELVAAMISAAAVDRQVIVATQSPLLLNRFKLESLLVTELGKDGGSLFRRLQKEEYERWLQRDSSIADLWLSNLIGGNP